MLIRQEKFQSNYTPVIPHTIIYLIGDCFIITFTKKYKSVYGSLNKIILRYGQAETKLIVQYEFSLKYHLLVITA